MSELNGRVRFGDPCLDRKRDAFAALKINYHKISKKKKTIKPTVKKNILR